MNGRGLDTVGYGIDPPITRSVSFARPVVLRAHFREDR